MHVGFVLNLNFMLLLLLQPPSCFMLSHCSFNHNLLTQFHSHLCCEKPPAFFVKAFSAISPTASVSSQVTIFIILAYSFATCYISFLKRFFLYSTGKLLIFPHNPHGNSPRYWEVNSGMHVNYLGFLPTQQTSLIPLCICSYQLIEKIGSEGNCGCHSVQPLHNKLLDELAQSHVQSQGWKFLRLEISYFSASLGNTVIFQYLV